MTPKGWMTLSALLNRFHAGAAAEPHRYLPKDEAQALDSHTVSAKGLSEFLTRPSAFIQHIHYSWLLPHIEQASPIVRKLFLSALDDRSATRLRTMTKETDDPFQMPERFKAFFRRHLYAKVALKADVLPPAFIPPSRLTSLLNLDKEHLLTIIDFLGIYDLAAQMAGNIDQKRLNALFSALTVQKREFLQSCLKRKTQVTSNRPPITSATPDREEINKWLHRAGLLRFTQALQGENSSFIWHLTRVLDVGRASLIEEQLSKQKADPKQQDQAIGLVEEVMQHLRYL